MKEIDPKEAPGVSGGYAPDDGGCLPKIPNPLEDPLYPAKPYPEPVPRPIDPVSFGPMQ
ncbi:MAG: hypothetical protein AB7P08_08150 [Burkholderiales bacterium]